MASGLKVLEARLAEDRTAICAPPGMRINPSVRPIAQGIRRVRWSWAGGRSRCADRVPGAMARRCRCPPCGRSRMRIR